MNMAANLRSMASGKSNLAQISTTKLKQMAGGILSAATVQAELKRRGIAVKTAAKVARDEATKNATSKNKIVIASVIVGGIALAYYMRRRSGK